MSDDAAAKQVRFLQRFLVGVPHLAALGVEYRGHGADWAELALPWRADLVGYPDTGTLASGAIYSLLDSAGGFATLVRRGALESHATLDLRLDYLAAPAAGLTVIGRMTCYRMTRQVAFVRGTAHAGDADRPIASASGTFMFTGMSPGAA